MKPWSPAKLDATKYAPDCWQIHDPLSNPTALAENMSEDCLYLNIFTPSFRGKGKKPLPVMIWLHGGAFMQGSGSRAEYNGIKLAQRGVVVVTLNYRLGTVFVQGFILLNMLSYCFV